MTTSRDVRGAHCPLRDEREGKKPTRGVPPLVGNWKKKKKKGKKWLSLHLLFVCLFVCHTFRSKPHTSASGSGARKAAASLLPERVGCGLCPVGLRPWAAGTASEQAGLEGALLKCHTLMRMENVIFLYVPDKIPWVVTFSSDSLKRGK